MPQRTQVPTSYLRQMLLAVERHGHDIHALLAAAGTCYEAIFHQEKMSAYDYGSLYQQIVLLMKDESFGILSGGRIPNGAFRMMCLAILHARNLESALHRCSDFYEICRGPTIKPVLIRKGRHAKVTFAPIFNVSQGNDSKLLANSDPETIRSTLSMWHHFISWLIGRRLVLKAAYFSFPRPDDAGYYHTLFQADVKFDQHANALVFNGDYLDMPLVQSEDSLRAFLKTAPYQLLVMVDDDNSLKSQVMAVLGRDFSRDLPSAEEMAQTMCMSVSTMRRRLAEEGTSYQQIKDECRKEAAITFLNAPQLTINEIARLMGFDEPSAFFRSFKKWTGMTPGEYRKAMHLHEPEV